MEMPRRLLQQQYRKYLTCPTRHACTLTRSNCSCHCIFNWLREVRAIPIEKFEKSQHLHRPPVKSAITVHAQPTAQKEGPRRAKNAACPERPLGSCSRCAEHAGRPPSADDASAREDSPGFSTRAASKGKQQSCGPRRAKTLVCALTRQPASGGGLERRRWKDERDVGRAQAGLQNGPRSS